MSRNRGTWVSDLLPWNVDAAGYRQCVNRYRTKATACGFKGQVAMAEAMS